MTDTTGCGADVGDAAPMSASRVTLTLTSFAGDLDEQAIENKIVRMFELVTERSATADELEEMRVVLRRRSASSPTDPE